MAMRTCSVSPTFSIEDDDYGVDDVDPWYEIDRITEKYQLAVQNEEKYIMESVFGVNGSMYKLIMGFSPARHYEPAIRFMYTASEMVNKTNHISFNQEEWNEFSSKLMELYYKYILRENEFEKDELNKEQVEQEIKLSNNVRITTSSFLDAKMLKVTNGTITFYLNETTLYELSELDEIVKSKLDRLQRLDFDKFYFKFIQVIHNILCKSNYQINPIDTMLYICYLSPYSIHIQCIREYLLFGKDKMLNDLDMKLSCIEVHPIHQ